MNAKFVSLALMSTTLLALPSLAAARTSTAVGNVPLTPTSPLYKTVLYVSQTTSLGETSAGPLNARIGPLTSSQHGYGVRTNFTDVGASSGMSGLPRIMYSGPLPTEAVLAAARLWMRTNSAFYFEGVRAYLQARGVSMAYFSYYQEVEVATATGPARRKGVMWSGTVDLSGRALYGDPRLVDAEPVFLDIHYYPLATGDGVLASEGYENAGKLVWRILNRKLEPMSGSTVIDVSGAYDEPVEETGDYGAVSCFIDKRHPSCNKAVPSAVPDAASIANSVGASGIFGFYAQAAQLEYVEDGGEYVPQLAVSYDTRELNCTALKEDVSVGKVVTFNGTLYFATLAGSFYEYALMDRISRTDVVAPTTYSREALLTYLAAANLNPSRALLSPFLSPGLPQVYSLDDTSAQEARDFLDRVVYIAPLEDKRQAATFKGLLDDAVKENTHSYIAKLATAPSPGSGGGGGGGGGPNPDVVQQTAAVNASAYYTRTGTTVSVAVSAPTFDYELGVGNTPTLGPDNNVSDGFYERSFSFNVADKAAIETFLLTHVGWDDYLQVSLNGKMVLQHPHGDMLALASSPEGSQCRYGYGRKPVYQCYESGDSGTVCSHVGWGEPELLENVDHPSLAQTSANANLQFTWGNICTGGDSEVCVEGYYISSMQGCDWLDRTKNDRATTSEDLRHLLVDGMNTITLRLAVGGGGEGWIRLRTSGTTAGCQ